MKLVGQAAINASKTKCDKGHRLSGKNLYKRPNGARVCRECARHNCRTYYRRVRMPL